MRCQFKFSMELFLHNEKKLVKFNSHGQMTRVGTRVLSMREWYENKEEILE